MEKLPKPDQQASALADAQGPRQRFSDAGMQSWCGLILSHFDPFLFA
jgi:hypothetical protein